MDPSTALSDASAKSAFSIGGLMSQINNLLGGTTSEGEIFSTLLSQDGAMQNASAATSVTSTPASATVDISSSASTDSGSLSQTLNDLSDALHQAIAALRHSGHTPSSTPASTASTSQSAQTTSTTVANTTAASASNSTSATTSRSHGKDKQSATNQNESQSSDTTAVTDSTTTSASDATQSTSDTSTTPDSQTLAAILAGLLLLVQTVVKDLKASSSTQTAAGAQGGAQLVVKTDPLTKAEQALADALAALTANKTATGDAGTDASTVADQTATNQDSANLADTSTDPLQRLLALIQKDMAQVTGATSATTQSSSTSSVQASAAITTESTTQLAALETEIKTVLSLLQHSKSTPSDASTTTSGTTTSAATDVTKTVPLAAAGAVSLSASQIPTTVAASTAAQPTNTSTQAQIFVSLNTASSYANSAGGSDSDAGQDMLAKDGSSQAPTANTNNNLAAQNAQTTGANSFANQLSAVRATTALTTSPSAVIDQVILQLNRGVKNGNDQMSLQLHPADLGKITVKLDMGADGKVQGTVTADNPATLQLLQKDSRSLERALQDAGLRADPGSLQFSLGGGSDGQSGQTAQGNSSGTANADGTVSASDDLGDGSDLVDPGSIAETYYVTPNGVNIRV